MAIDLTAVGSIATKVESSASKLGQGFPQLAGVSKNLSTATKTVTEAVKHLQGPMTGGLPPNIQQVATKTLGVVTGASSNSALAGTNENQNAKLVNSSTTALSSDQSESSSSESSGFSLDYKLGATEKKEDAQNAVRNS
jgi:hypothetical protein